MAGGVLEQITREVEVRWSADGRFPAAIEFPTSRRSPIGQSVHVRPT